MAGQNFRVGGPLIAVRWLEAILNRSACLRFYLRLELTPPKIGAKRVMKRLGASSMEDFLDKLGLPRIAPASAVVGDVIGFPGGRDEDHQWTALGVHVGASDILGFAAADGEDAIVRVGPVSVATVAWRVG